MKHRITDYTLILVVTLITITLLIISLIKIQTQFQIYEIRRTLEYSFMYFDGLPTEKSKNKSLDICNRYSKYKLHKYNITNDCRILISFYEE